MSLSILLVIPAIILVAIIVAMIRGGSKNILPGILIGTVSIILLGSLLAPMINEASADTSITYDDYVEIDADTEVSGSFEKVTSGDITYAHAKALGMGTIGGDRYNVQKAPLDVFLIMGQSNAAYSYYDTPTATPVAKPGQIYYYGTETQPVTQTVTGTGMYDAVNVDGSAKIGHLEMPFMSEYNELTDHKVYTINTGWNGANIAILTVGGTHYNYEQRTARSGFDAIDSNHYVIDTIGYIWLQGESDAGLDTPVSEYKADFLKLYNAIAGKSTDVFTNRFTMDKAFIVQTRTERGPNTAEALTQLAAENPDIYMATDITLSFTVDNGMVRSDNLHYTQQGFNAIGVAVARFIAELPDD